MQPPTIFLRLVCMTSSVPSRRWPAGPGMLGVGCLIASVVLTACASILRGEPTVGGGNGGPSSTPYEHASGAEDVLVSIDAAGGYVPLEFNLRNTAEFLLLGDGTAIVPAAVAEIYPGPAIYPLQSATVSEDKIQGLLRAADDAGLLDGEIDYGDPGWTDLPNTNVNIMIGGRAFSQSAYGLSFDDDSSAQLSDSERAARATLAAFIETAQGLVGADSSEYVPSAVLAFRLSASVAPPVEEPELQQEPRPWPIATVPPPIADTYPSSCQAITGAEVTELLTALDQANELTPWLIGADPPARMAFRPLLAGDPGCTG